MQIKYFFLLIFSAFALNVFGQNAFEEDLTGTWQWENNFSASDTLIFARIDEAHPLTNGRNPDRILYFYQGKEGSDFKAFSNVKTTNGMIDPKPQEITFEVQINGDDTVFTDVMPSPPLYGCTLSPFTWKFENCGTALLLVLTNTLDKKMLRFEVLESGERELVLVEIGE